MTLFPPVEELLPHRPPMVMLDEVLSWDGKRIVCVAAVRSRSPFEAGGQLQAVATLEHMAQCVAAFAGMLARERGEAARIGFLVAVREMDLLRDRITVGARLVVEAERVWGGLALGHFKCSVHDRSELVARASLSVVREDAREPA